MLQKISTSKNKKEIFSLFWGKKKIPIFFKRKLKITRARIYEVPAASQKIRRIQACFLSCLLACLLAFFFVWPELAKSSSYG
jgi:hypothetical protein